MSRMRFFVGCLWQNIEWMRVALVCILLSSSLARGQEVSSGAAGARFKPAPAQGVDPSSLPQNWTFQAQLQGDEPGARSRIRETSGDLGSSAPMELDPGVWWILLKTPGAWAEPFEIRWPETEAMEHEVSLYPAGRVTGRLRNREINEGFYVRFEPREDKDREDRPTGWAPCFFEAARPEATQLEDTQNPSEKRFNCEVPFGEYDLQFWVSGFAESYVWAVELGADGPSDVGELSMTPGSSLVGWVEAAGARVPLQDAKLELHPAVGGEGRSLEANRRATRRIRKARPDARGFFQLVGLAPGVYTLSASLEGFASARASVRLWPGKTTRLDDPPLLLRPPAELEILLHPPEPPGDPPNDRWSVRLDRIDPAGRPLEELGRASTDPGGGALFPRVPFGLTRLLVLDAEASLWHVETFQIEAAREERFIDLRLTEVRGSVHRADEPISGMLYFGHSFSGRIALEIDEKGRFEGYLPGPGPWQVVVESEDPRLKKTFAGVEAEDVPGKSWKRLDLQILETALRGRVVDSENRPFVGAQVTSVAMADEGALQAPEALAVEKTNELGEFEILGPATGKTVVSALAVFDGKRFASREPTVVEIEAGERGGDPVELVLYPTQRFEGRVVHNGSPVSGAVVSAIDVENLTTSNTPRLVTDEEGSFGLEIPDSTQSLLLAVAAPGFAYTMLRASVTDGAEVQLGRESGTLVLEMSEQLFGYEREIAGLFYNGGFMPALSLQEWALRRGGDRWQAPSAEIPELAPGTYRLCRIPRLGLQSAVLGAIDPAECVDGYLPPGGRLRLELNASAAAEATAAAGS